MSSTRKLFLFIGLPLVIVFITIVVWQIRQSNQTAATTNQTSESTDNSATRGRAQSSSDEPPIKIKHLGIELADYDPTTGMAGDLKFTKAVFPGGIQLLYSDYGYVIKAQNSASGQDKANPQPTFIAPLGTKVRSIVDGVVYDVPKLYSGDYSIQVYDGKNGNWLYEMEHVINPVVKKGDRVTAGQVVAEVSNYDAHNYDGQGLFEIGILKGGNPPSHVCPFNYLDSSIKATITKQLSSLMKSWEEYRGDQTLYPEESTYQVLGCLSLNPIEG